MTYPVGSNSIVHHPDTEDANSKATLVSGWETSPVGMLSDEMLVRLFGFLNGEDLANASRVCRKFFTVSSDESLWKKLFTERFGELNVADRASINFKNEYYQRARLPFLATQALRKDVEILRISHRLFDKETVKGLAEAHPDSTSFYLIRNIENEWDLDGREQADPLNNSSLNQIALHCKNIMDLYFESTSSTEFDAISMQQLNEFCSKYPLLNSIKIEGFSELNGRNFANIFGQHRELRTIHYSNYFITNEFFNAIPGWQQLHSLTLKGFNNAGLTDAALNGLAGRQWRHLDIGVTNHHFSQSALIQLFHSLSGMKHFGFAGCPKIDDDQFISLLRRSPDLEYLKLDNLENLSERSAEALITLCPKLKQLILTGCSGAFSTALREKRTEASVLPQMAHCYIS